MRKGSTSPWSHGTESGYTYRKCRCPECRAAHAAYARLRRPGSNEQRAQAERYRARKDWIDSIKLEYGCADCGYSQHAVALDFDHVRGEKVAGVGAMVSWSCEAILAEIAKCDVVCANCHRVRTHST